MNINKNVLKIALIYILILVSVAATFYYVGYVAGVNYSIEFYTEEMKRCICNINPF